MSTSLDLFILMFNKMALIFLGVLIVFTISSFKFHQLSPDSNPLDYQV